MTRPDPVTLTAPKVLAELDRRSIPERSPEAVAARDLTRYYRLLAVELARLALTHGEVMLVWHAMTTMRTARQEGRPAPEGLVEAVAEQWRQSWALSDMREVRGLELVERLKALSPGAMLALIDGIERFDAHLKRRGWSRPVVAMLREVGLVRGDE